MVGLFHSTIYYALTLLQHTVSCSEVLCPTFEARGSLTPRRNDNENSNRSRQIRRFEESIALLGRGEAGDRMMSGMGMANCHPNSAWLCIKLYGPCPRTAGPITSYPDRPTTCPSGLTRTPSSASFRARILGSIFLFSRRTSSLGSADPSGDGTEDSSPSCEWLVSFIPKLTR